MCSDLLVFFSCDICTPHRNWGRVVHVEQRCREVEGAADLCNDLSVTHNNPIRLLHMFFERDRYDPSSHSGLHLLRGLLHALPDNKLVEDIHNGIRRDSNANPNPIQRLCQIQDLCNSSDVLDDRGIPHPAKLSKEVWCSKYKRASGKYKKIPHYSWKHKLNPEWSRVMGTKKWHTVSEETLRRSAAAWHWLHVGMADNPVASGQFSTLLLQGIVVRHSASPTAFVSLGHATWGALAWPLQVLRDDGGFLSWCCDLRPGHVGVKWLHVSDPMDWVSFAHEGVRTGHGILFKQTAPEEPLLKAVLRRPAHKLSHQHLLRLGLHYGLEVGSGSSREELLNSLGAHLGGDDVDFMQKAMYEEDISSVALLAEDPLFEAAYDDMDPEDKREFADVTEARRRGRVRKTFELGAHRRAAAKKQTRKRRRVAAKAAGAPAAAPAAAAQAAPAAAGPVPPAPVGAGPAPPEAAAAALVPPAPAQMPPAPAAAAAAVPPPAPPPPPPAQEMAQNRIPKHALRSKRAEPFGTSWILAEVYSSGSLTSWSCRCFYHIADGQQCNISLTMGDAFTPEEAKHRVLEWSVRGASLQDGPGMRELHMSDKPRHYQAHELRSVAELTLLAGRA